MSDQSPKSHVIHVARPVSKSESSPLAARLHELCMNRRTMRIVLVLVVLSIVYAALKISWTRYAEGEQARIRTQIMEARERASSQSALSPETEKAGSPILLDGQYECKLASTSATISRGRAAVVAALPATSKMASTSSRMIFDGDCLYSWTEGKAGGGTKQCGMGQYLNAYSMFGSLIGGGSGADVRSLFTLIEGKNLLDSQSESQISALLDSCQSVKVASESAFLLPKNVSFESVE